MTTTVKKVAKPEQEAKKAPRARVTKAKAEAVVASAPAFAGRYVEAVGRRKTAIARVRLYQGTPGFVVNGKSLADYFKTERQRADARLPLDKASLAESSGVSVRVEGGGLTGQSEATAHGLARALATFDPALRPAMRSIGCITRDSRMVERKKYGLKKARRAPQWSKR